MMKKQLPKPENWQDFEDLCKMLWGEIWKIPLKIKKNGRAGQNQNGVDIYGVPKGEKGYWGIQCKGKDDYTSAKLTVNEITTEVGKAKDFNPPLQVFIIATSSNKDVAVEEFVRVLNIENIKNGGFEIEIYCWEDIVDLIYQHSIVLDFYLKSIKFRNEYDFNITLNNSENDKTIISPLYYRGLITDVLKKQPAYNPRSMVRGNILDLTVGFDGFSSSKEKNMACCLLNFELINCGNKVLEDWKLLLQFEKRYKYLGYRNSAEKQNISDFLKSDLDIKDNNVVYCDEKPLIQRDKRDFELWITPELDLYEIQINWKILSRDFSLEGNLILEIEPTYEMKNLTNEVNHSYEIKSPREYSKEAIIYK